MSTRDELAADLSRAFASPQSVETVAGWLIAEGWRKMPSLNDVLEVLAAEGIGPNGEEPHSWRCSDKGRYPGDCECPREIARAILALMDRGQ